MDQSGHGLAILLVEDEPRLRLALARALAAYGHTVDEAATCEDAANALLAKPYDLLLLDVNLPDATGWDLLRILSAAGGGRPVVIVMSAVPPRTERLREFQPMAVLHKPFPISALLQLVTFVADEQREVASGLPTEAEFS